MPRCWNALIALGLIVSVSNFAAAQDSSADALRAEAQDLYLQEGPETALRVFQRALELYRSARDRSGEAITLGNIGNCYKRLGEYQRALELLDQALTIKRLIGDRLEEGKTLSHLGLVYWEMADYPKAIKNFEQAIAIGRELGHARLEGSALNNLSLVYDELGDYPRSLDQYQRVLEIYRGTEFERGEGDTLGNIGRVYMLLGRFREAQPLFERALEISSRLDLKLAMSQDLGNLGLCYLGIGEVDKALESFDRAITLSRKIGVAYDEAYWLKGKGSALIQLGRYGEGLDLHRQALAVYESEQKPQDYAEALYEIGELYLLLGDIASSERHLEHALEIASRIGFERGISDSQLLLGDLEMRRGRVDAAVNRYLEALASSSKIEHRVGKSRAHLRLAAARLEQNRPAESLHQAQTGFDAAREIPSPALQAEAQRLSGDAERLLGRNQAALEAFDSAESLLGAATDPETLWRIYLGRARSMVQLDRQEEAVRELKKAATLIESIRGRLREQRFRAGYLQDKHAIYEELVRLLLDLGKLDEAFRASERLRTNSYFGALNMASSASRTDEQRRREIELRLKIRQLENSLTDETLGLGGSQRDRAVGLFTRELFEAEQEYQSFLDDLRPMGLMNGTSVGVPSVANLQENLASDEALLEWVVGAERTLVFVLTRDSLNAKSLSFGQKILRPQIELLRDLIARKSDDSWNRPASSLYEHLIEPLESEGWLSDKDSLMLVPHGILHDLPFSALMRPAGVSGRLLIHTFDLTYLPTASVLAAAIQRPTAGRSLLAVAPESAQLAFTAAEAEGVAALYDDSELMLAESATEKRFKALAGKFRILHLATHGYFSPLNPLLSGLELNEGGGEDGRLEVHEIMDLELGAELVTLSACSSALGSSYFNEIPVGSEWVGLSRAFLSAGSAAVLATLWPVDDRATMEFMKDFYGQLATRSPAGESDALATIQRGLASNGKSTAHPYYWAPFVLMHGSRQGDSRKTLNSVRVMK